MFSMASSQAPVSIWFVIGLVVIFGAIFLGCTSGNKARQTGNHPIWVYVVGVTLILLIAYRFGEIAMRFPHAMHMLFH